MVLGGLGGCWVLMLDRTVYLASVRKGLSASGPHLGKDEEERKALLIVGYGEYNLGSKAARGKGFIGTQVQDLLEKKSKVICKAKKRHRFKACAKCAGCRRENCGSCKFCLDMPKYGGKQLLKQKCKNRVCVNPTVRTCDKCEWSI